jgi:glycosyltransferase involved in cell wall biosynthesis
MKAVTDRSLPSFSLVLETVNLGLADIDDVRRSLASMAQQDLSPEAANEVVMVESGEVPPEVLATLREDFTWLKIVKVPNETGYEEAKMAGVKETTGEVIVFFDADCEYQPGWLRHLIEGLAERPDVDVLGGETMIHTDSAWAIASAVLFSFDWYTDREDIYEAERFHFNNVAFRRAALERVPPPTNLPVFRLPTTYYAALLRESGFKIARQPLSRCRHESPNGLAHFFWRYIVFGLDGVYTQKLPWPGRPGARHNSASRGYLMGRFFSVGTNHLAKVFRRLVRIFAEDPKRLVYLPIVLPLVLIGGFLMICGYVSGLLAPKLLPSVMPDSVKRGTAYDASRAPV